MSSGPLNLQDMILRLQEYWAAQKCIIYQPYDMEVGAGTMSPGTFLKSLGPEPWRVAYVQPCRRPTDGRYGENPNRVQHYYQYQVILKPSPDDVQDLYLGSLEAIGSIWPSTMCGSWRTTGNLQLWGLGAWAGRCGLMVWRLRSSRISTSGRP